MLIVNTNEKTTSARNERWTNGNDEPAGRGGVGRRVEASRSVVFRFVVVVVLGVVRRSAGALADDEPVDEEVDLAGHVVDQFERLGVRVANHRHLGVVIVTSCLHHLGLECLTRSSSKLENNARLSLGLVRFQTLVWREKVIHCYKISRSKTWLDRNTVRVCCQNRVGFRLQ